MRYDNLFYCLSLSYRYIIILSSSMYDKDIMSYMILWHIRIIKYGITIMILEREHKNTEQKKNVKYKNKRRLKIEDHKIRKCLLLLLLLLYQYKKVSS